MIVWYILTLRMSEQLQFDYSAMMNINTEETTMWFVLPSHVVRVYMNILPWMPNMISPSGTTSTKLYASGKSFLFFTILRHSKIWEFFYKIGTSPYTRELEPYGGIRCTMSNYQMPFSIISDREIETSWSNYNHDLLSVPITIHWRYCWLWNSAGVRQSLFVTVLFKLGHSHLL